MLTLKNKLVTTLHGDPSEVLENHVMQTPLDFISYPVSDAAHSVQVVLHLTLSEEIRLRNRALSPRDICSIQEIL